MLLRNLFGGGGYFGNTANANTRIQIPIPNHPQGRTLLTSLAYTPGATTHTLTLMRPQSDFVIVASPAAASQAVVVLSKDPGLGTQAGALAANDLLVLQNDDGSLFVGKVSSVAAGANGQISVTLTVSLSVALAGIGNNKVWDYGVVGDKDNKSGLVYGTVTLTNGSTTKLNLDSNFEFASWGYDQPLLLDVDNATNAGAYNEIHWAHAIN